MLKGLSGDDDLRGASGNDTIAGGNGADLLTGGDDADTFVFEKDFETDIILDYELSDMDSIYLMSFDDVSVQQTSYQGYQGIAVYNSNGGSTEMELFVVGATEQDVVDGLQGDFILS
jgi:Ca2+-binding RTX toxin-like protein